MTLVLSLSFLRPNQPLWLYPDKSLGKNRRNQLTVKEKWAIIVTSTTILKRRLSGQWKYRQSTTYNDGSNRFFEFTMVLKQYAFSRNWTFHFEFWSFSGLAICKMIFSCDVGQWQQATVPNQVHDHKGKQLIRYNVLYCQWFLDIVI